MTNVLVTSLSTGGSSGADRLTENITLNFAQVEVTYTPENPDGSGGDAVEYAYDIAANAEL